MKRAPEVPGVRAKRASGGDKPCNGEPSMGSWSNSRVADRLLDTMWCPTKVAEPSVYASSTEVASPQHDGMQEDLDELQSVEKPHATMAENPSTRLPRKASDMSCQMDGPKRTLRHWIQDKDRPGDIKSCMLTFWQVRFLSLSGVGLGLKMTTP